MNTARQPLRLFDGQCRSLARYLGRDGCLSRADMLELFQQVENDSVTSSELGDLKDIVAGGSYARYAPYLSGPPARHS